MDTCLLVECNNKTSTKFCSFRCGTIHQHRVNPKHPKTRQCLRDECSAEFVLGSGTYAKKYCSSSCAAMVNNPRRAKKKYCIQCGDRYLGSGEKYCSNRCNGEAVTQNRIRLWLSGSWDGSSKSGLSRTIRTYLIDLSGNRCTSPDCAVPGGFRTPHPITGKVPLEVDHIDGDCTNNLKENLIVLCLNCHGLTPTYRALNKNSKRTYRKTQ